MRARLVAFTVALGFSARAAAPAFAAPIEDGAPAGRFSAADGAAGAPAHVNSIALRPIDLFFSIYVAQYERQLTTADEIIVGAYDLRGTTALFGPPYPGTYELYSPLIGYRRYLWRGLHVEGVLLPGYAVYHDTTESSTRHSIELWSEVHAGYRFELALGAAALFVTPQILAGFCFYKSNEPSSFRSVDRDHPAFRLPDLYVAPNVNIGVRF